MQKQIRNIYFKESYIAVRGYIKGKFFYFYDYNFVLPIRSIIPLEDPYDNYPEGEAIYALQLLQNNLGQYVVDICNYHVDLGYSMDGVLLNLKDLSIGHSVNSENNTVRLYDTSLLSDVTNEEGLYRCNLIFKDGTLMYQPFERSDVE